MGQQAAIHRHDEETSHTLLFVDDEQNILSSLKRLFRSSGHRILTATGGQEGLAILERQHVDLVISDMRMPGMDGAQFLEKVATQWPDTVRILLTGYADISSTVAAINNGGIYKYISKPWDENDLKISVQRALEQKSLEQERRRLASLVCKQNEELKALNQSLENKVEARTNELNQTMAMLEKAFDTLKEGYAAAIKVFSSMIEIREQSVSGHTARVAENACKVARAMGLVDSQVQDIHYAALLHDIGKIALPDTLIRRPYHSLSDEERAEVDKHPVVGEALLMSLEPLQDAAVLIRHHHEHFDGSGHPDGLKQDAIPLGARILSVVNGYDDFLSGSLFPGNRNEEEAKRYLLDQAGIAYDPEIVEIFLSQLRKENRQADAPSVSLSCDKLKPGMRLAKDIVTKSGVMLLSEGHILDENLIAKIQRLAKATGTEICIRVYTN